MKQTKNENKEVRIIPLGGLDQIGLNITLIEYEDEILIVDCGIAFPDIDMLGIDMIIPDFTYLRENADRVKGLVITHGHEDHIGAIPYLLRELSVPIYATRLTLGILNKKLEEHKSSILKTKKKTVKPGQSINLGSFRVEFIKVNHSIGDACALAIHTPAGIIVHTGDYKIDYTPLYGETTNLQRFAELGKKGVLAMMSDSTNAEKPGSTQTERMVAGTLDRMFQEHEKNRIIIATFASNVDRVQLIIHLAAKYNRKVILEGRSMVNIITTAQELGYMEIPDNTLVDISQMNNYTDEQLVLITTGSQGETMAALSRMAMSTHRKVSIKPNDAIIFSSHPIPGNEKAVSKIINLLSMKGADVIFQDTHVSGHACQEELRLMYSLIKPKYAIPVHGEYKHLSANAKIAREMGIPKENVNILNTGDVAELTQDSFEVKKKVKAGAVFVDGLGVGDVGNIVLRDRELLGNNGIVIVTVVIDRKSRQIASGPDIVSRGFIYVKESEELVAELRARATETVEMCLQKNLDWNGIKNKVRDNFNDYLWRTMKRAPVIMTIISEV